MAKKVLLLMNLGSPESTEVEDVKKYLDEFLMDGRVIDINYVLRWLLVKGIITKVRPKKTAEKYKTIWTENGSPLIYTTQLLSQKIEENLDIKTYVCMRYGKPRPKDVLQTIKNENKDLEELVFLPLYPHYALSSYETAVAYVKQEYNTSNYHFKLNTIKPYYSDKAYIKALSKSIAPYLENGYDHIVFSYHGIPERHIKKTDVTKSHCLKKENCCTTDSEAHKYCYRHQVLKTTELVVEKLNIDESKYSVGFQSRLGMDKWLSPNAADLFAELPKKNIKNLVVVCPAFTSDCLETLEEIKEEGEEIFLNNGGEHFALVPCLNTDSEWVNAINCLISKA